jgi:hypothetical protein
VCHLPTRPARAVHGRCSPSCSQRRGGDTAEGLIRDIFTDPTIDFIHTRNVHAGCFMFSVTRAGA